MASRLTNILQQEYKTKGLVSGAFSAMSKSSKEKMDVRNILFGGSGLGSIVGRKVFGKGYSATAGSNNTGVSNPLKESTNLNNPILEQINQNTSYMPAMARDMNVLRQSFSKFLISQKISPANTPDKYFEKAKQREDLYESTFNKKSKSTTPTKINNNDKKNTGGVLGILSSILGGTIGAVGGIIGGLVGGIASIGATLASGLLGGIIGFLAKSKLGKIILGLLGISAASALASATENSGPMSSLDDFLSNLIPSETSGEPGRENQKNNTSIGDVVTAGTAVVGSKLLTSKLKTPTPITPTATSVATGVAGTPSSSIINPSTNKPFTSSEMDKMDKQGKMEKLAKKVASLQKKGLFGKLAAAILNRFGGAIASRIVIFLASIGASVASGGVLAPALTAINYALFGYLIFEIYNFVTEFSDAVEKDENSQKQKSNSPEMIDDSNSEEGIKQVNSPNQVGSTGKGRISGRYGDDRGTHKHEGVDITGNIGDPVYATGDGKVVRADENDPDGYGKQIEILHPDGTKTKYAHLNAYKVSVGEQVKKGQQIAELGNTGRSTGPHLHYEKITKNGKIEPSDAEVKLALNPSGVTSQSTQLASLGNDALSPEFGGTAGTSSAGQQIDGLSKDRELARVAALNNKKEGDTNINNIISQAQRDVANMASQPGVFDQYFANKLLDKSVI
jgi:murein DD-endopeptidase MepM/ murein hydrolase activator NlpD